MFESEEGTNYILNNYLEQVVASKQIMEILGKSKYAGKAVIQTPAWKQEILNSIYVEEFDKGSITTPKMTANSDNGYEAYAPSENNYAGGQLAYCAFDGRNTSFDNSSKAGQYMNANNGAIPTYVQLEFPNEITIYKVKLYFYIDEGYQMTNDLKGSIEMGETKIDFETEDRQQEMENLLLEPIKSKYIRINFETYNWKNPYEQVVLSECIYYAR